MAEPIEEYAFSHKELVEALIKKQGLHDGIWMLNIRFGIGAINVSPPTGPDDGPKNEASPAAVVPISSVGIRKVKEVGPLSVNAAEVNPAPPKSVPKRKASQPNYLLVRRDAVRGSPIAASTTKRAIFIGSEGFLAGSFFFLAFGFCIPL